MRLGNKLWMAGIVLLFGCSTAENLKADSNAKSLECLLVRNSNIKASDELGELNKNATADDYVLMASRGHSIIPGDSIVMLVRDFSGSSTVADRQSFMKITMKTDELVTNGELTNVSESYFTKGSSEFVDAGFYYYSKDQIKTVSVTEKNGEYQLTIDQSLPSVRAFDESKGDIALHISCPLQYRSVEQLSVWEGRPSDGHEAFLRKTRKAD